MRTMVGTTVAVVLCTAAWPGLSDDAGADQISTTRDQIGTLQAAVVAGATRIRQLTVAYQQATVQADTLSQQVRADRVQFVHLQARLAGTEASLRHAAIVGYVGGYSGVPGTGPGPSAAATDPSVRAAYAGLAASDLQDVVDQYRVARSNVVAAGTTLAAQQRASQAAAAGVAQARLAALDEAVTEQAQVNSLEGRLAGLVQAAQAQAAQAQAARAVQAAGAARATEAAATGSQRLRPVIATQGLPVNNGIVAVVQTVVGAGPAQAPKASAGGSVSPRPAGSKGPDRPAPVVTRTVAPPPAAAPTTTPTTVRPTPTTARPAPTPRPPPSPPPPPPPAAPGPGGGTGGVWLQLRECESGNNYRENTGNGYYGAYQFSQQTWTDLGYPGRPDLESPSLQDQAAMKLEAQSGWGSWPACAAALGLL